MKPELLFDAKVYLGEGPIWDARSQTLYWVDIFAKRIYAGPDLFAELEEYEFLGCIAPREKGGLILALSGDASHAVDARFSFASLEPSPALAPGASVGHAQGKPGSANLTLLSSLTDESAGNRFNDGKCDPRGRFLAGTMDKGETEPTGSLYSFDGRSVTKILSGVTVSNGMTWSPDSKTFYYIDTPTREVRAFDYDLESGAIANPRVAVYISEALGWPDGMTSDMQGHLWIAMWGGAKVTQWNPNTGELLEQIAVPAMNVSSCVFGGRNMNELYLTSARKGLDEAVLKQYPLTGGVFRLETKVEGMPTFAFAG
ncbi:MAG TPA: SMP-30/gluconolactonase/LRE family protein [Anaerolineales bacterium]|nr:SMP-30/gluconolactonase/LRE family protein [Anaerolineales bacterium]